jgi:hypothetical protein
MLRAWPLAALANRRRCIALSLKIQIPDIVVQSLGKAPGSQVTSLGCDLH